MKRFQNARIVIVLIVLVLIGVGLYAWYAARQIRTKYAAFETAETAYETAAFKPAVQNNPLRQEVGYLLSQVLQAKLSDAQRLDDAHQGVERVKEIETEVDDMKTQGDAVLPKLNSLESAAHAVGVLRQRTDLLQIVALAHRQAQIISDIRGLSYGTDYYTREVFERIIDDQGKMTDEHKTYLNGMIPDLERKFNQRENLYSELKANADKIHALATQLGYEQ